MGQWLVRHERRWVSRESWRGHTAEIWAVVRWVSQWLFPALGTQLSVLFSRSLEFSVGTCRKWEITKPRFESQPGVEYKLREDGIQARRLSWPQVPEGGSKPLCPERVRDIASLRSWDLPFVEQLLVDKPGEFAAPSLCSRSSRVARRWSLPRRGTGTRSVQTCQLICWRVSTPCGLSATSRWNWQSSPIAPISSVLAEKAGTKRLYQNRSPLGLGRRSCRESRTLCLNMADSVLRQPRRMHWPQIAASRSILGMLVWWSQKTKRYAEKRKRTRQSTTELLRPRKSKIDRRCIRTFHLSTPKIPPKKHTLLSS